MRTPKPRRNLPERLTTRPVVAGLLLAVAVAGCHRKAAKLTEQSFELPNGMQVDLVAGRCGDGAEIVVLYAVGSDHDPAGRSGMAQVVAGAAGVAAAADHTLAARAVDRDGITSALDEAAARMGRLTVTAGDLARARGAALAELARRRGGDAAATAISYAAEAVSPTPGDGWRGGIASEIEAITAAELDGFWRAHMTPANARLVVVGRFDAAAIRGHVEAGFAALAAGTPPVARPPVPASVTGTLVMGDAPASIAVAVPAPAPTAPLFPAFLVLAARTADGVQIAYDPLVAPATLSITAALQPGEQAEAAATRVRAAVATALARPLMPAEVAAARTRFASFLGARGLDAAACARDRRGFAVGRARRAQLGLDGAALSRALDTVTPAQLAEAAARFDAKHSAAVVAGGVLR